MALPLDVIDGSTLYIRLHVRVCVYTFCLIAHSLVVRLLSFGLISHLDCPPVVKPNKWEGLESSFRSRLQKKQANNV